MLKTCNVRPAVGRTVRPPQGCDKRSRHTFQCENLLVRVHNGRVGRDWSPQNIVGVCKVYDDNLVRLIDLLAHANEVVRLESKGL